jgi:hypothetical protein
MKPQPPKTPSKLSDSVHHQLSLYALAASAAGVGVLALAQPADAKIVYTPAHKWLPVNQYYYLDFNHDGVNDFKFLLASSTWSPGFNRALSVRWVATSQSQNQIYSIGGAAALPKGKKVGPKSPGFKYRVNAALMFRVFSNPDCGSNGRSGPWLNVKGQAYLGVRFAIKGQVHCGWARMGNISHNKPVKALLTGYAYETVPNKPIITGKTKGPDVITTQPASLGHLAAGASVIPAWRTGKQQPVHCAEECDRAGMQFRIQEGALSAVRLDW